MIRNSCGDIHNRHFPAILHLIGDGAVVIGLLIAVYDFAELFAKPSPVSSRTEWHETHAAHWSRRFHLRLSAVSLPSGILLGGLRVNWPAPERDALHTAATSSRTVAVHLQHWSVSFGIFDNTPVALGFAGSTFGLPNSWVSTNTLSLQNAEQIFETPWRGRPGIEVVQRLPYHHYKKRM